MAHKIGEMFYVGKTPWHELGRKLNERPNLEEALHAGGLDWTVSTAPLLVADEPQSKVPQRVAVLRDDRESGAVGRVLGVVHPAFQLLQNRDGMTLLDSLLGTNQRIYETGGYLKQGEVVWLQAALQEPICIGETDELNTFLLFSNSHDGSRAIDIRLTTIRVVCNNTLTLALNSKKTAGVFRRNHGLDLRVISEQAKSFFKELLKEQAQHQEIMNRMATAPCGDVSFQDFLKKLLPDPSKPASADTNQKVANAFETRLMTTRKCRDEITQVRRYGCTQRLSSNRVPAEAESWWSALNAVTAWVDHVQEVDGDQFADQMFGAGDGLKAKAYGRITELLK